MLAKMQSAQARIQIQEQLEGLSVDAEVKALDNVRDTSRRPSPRPTSARAVRVVARFAAPGAAQPGRRGPGEAAVRRAQGQAGRSKAAQGQKTM